MTTRISKTQASRNENGRYIRTNVVLDADLLEKAFAYSESKTRKGLIDEALRFFVRMHAQLEMRELRGKVEWVGELDEYRDETRWPEDQDEMSQYVAAPTVG